MGNIEIRNVKDLAILERRVSEKIAAARSLVSSFIDVIVFSEDRIQKVKYHFDMDHDNYDLLIEFQLKAGFSTNNLLSLIKERRKEIVVVDLKECFKTKQLFIKKGKK